MYWYSTAISAILMRVPATVGEPLHIFGLISTWGCSVFVCSLPHLLFNEALETLNLYRKKSIKLCKTCMSSITCIPMNLLGNTRRQPLLGTKYSNKISFIVL